MAVISASRTGKVPCAGLTTALPSRQQTTTTNRTLPIRILLESSHPLHPPPPLLRLHRDRRQPRPHGIDEPFRGSVHRDLTNRNGCRANSSAPARRPRTPPPGRPRYRE